MASQKHKIYKYLAVVPIFLMALFFYHFSTIKKYKYIEVYETEYTTSGIIKKDQETVIIKAKTDSAAYLDAYERFYASKAYLKIHPKNIFDNPVEFKLLDEDGKQIQLTTSFSTQRERENEIKKRYPLTPFAR